MSKPESGVFLVFVLSSIEASPTDVSFYHIEFSRSSSVSWFVAQSTNARHRSSFRRFGAIIVSLVDFSGE